MVRSVSARIFLGPRQSRADIGGAILKVKAAGAQASAAFGSFADQYNPPVPLPTVVVIGVPGLLAADGKPPVGTA